MGAGHAQDESSHRRHLALTALVGVGLVVCLTVHLVSGPYCLLSCKEQKVKT
jgi:hypothetical protein